VLLGEWLAPGVHVNAVGACRHNQRELDGAAIRRARIVVDRRESAMAEAGDILLAIAEGAVGPNSDPIAAELGQILAGSATGRRTEEEITLFKSLGLAVQDLAAARDAYRNALEAGAGIPIDLGGRRDA
jgi:ornithine cyclodeaminase